jgi:norsolorinic acid ketoreductase
LSNAGIADYWDAARITPADTLLEHYKVNVIRPLLLFQATAELLDASPKPKFVAISSTAGSIASQDNFSLETKAYGSPKAAVIAVTGKIHLNPQR